MHFSHVLLSALALGATALPSQPGDDNVDVKARSDDDFDVKARADEDFDVTARDEEGDLETRDDGFEVNIKMDCGWGAFRRGRKCYCYDNRYMYDPRRKSCYSYCYNGGYWSWKDHACRCRRKGYRYDYRRRGCYKF